ncbi:MAG: acyl-CoA dehydrogenase family protein [Actinomycetota bacterium]
MDLAPSDEQQAIVEALREYAADEIRPAARDAEAAGTVSDRIRGQLAEMGLVCPVAEEFGGQGRIDALTAVMVAEELAWGDPGIAFALLASGSTAVVIDQVASPAQRAELLPRFAAGALGFVAVTERDAGSDASEIDARATREAGGTSLSGTKYGVPFADTASVRLVLARGSDGPALWALAPGAEPILEREDKLGLRSAPTFKLRLDGASAAAEPVGPGAALASAMARHRLVYAGVALGLARASLEYATTYAGQRTAFGRPIGAFQAISFKIADHATELEAARLMTWRAAWGLDAGSDDAVRLVAAACAQALSAALAAADDGVQILGGHGFMRDHPVELWYRDAMTLAALDSPSLVGELFALRATAAAFPNGMPGTSTANVGEEA